MNIVAYVKKLAEAVGFDPESGDIVLTKGKKITDDVGGKAITDTEARAVGGGGFVLEQRFIVPEDHNGWVEFVPEGSINIRTDPDQTYKPGFKCRWVQLNSQTVTFDADFFINCDSKFQSRGAGAMGWIYSPDGTTFFVSGALTD